MNTPIRAMYDQVAGLGDETVQGPYLSHGKIRTFGLKVDPVALKAFLCWYLKEPLKESGIAFDFCDEEICLQVVYFKNRQGRNASLVWRTVTFLIPVTCSFGSGPKEFGFVPVFSFSSNMYGVISLCEINGSYTRAAEMWSPNDLWTEDLHKNAPHRDVFTVHTEVMPKIVESGEMVRRLLLAVTNRDQITLPLSKLQSKLRTEVENTGAYAYYTLKQFPNQSDANRSCYQGIVRTEHRPVGDYEMKPHDHSGVVRLYEYESHQIKHTLGLDGKLVRDKDGECYHEIQPTFYTAMEGCFREEFGRTLAYRSSTVGHQQGWIHCYPEGA